MRDAAEDVLGGVGLEFLGDKALLRSVAVHPDRRDTQLGCAILGMAEQLRSHPPRAGRLVLLTASAERFFGRLGFICTERASVSEPMRRTQQFATICPASAVCLVKAIDKIAARGH